MPSYYFLEEGAKDAASALALGSQLVNAQVHIFIFDLLQCPRAPGGPTAVPGMSWQSCSLLPHPRLRCSLAQLALVASSAPAERGRSTKHLHGAFCTQG